MDIQAIIYAVVVFLVVILLLVVVDSIADRFVLLLYKGSDNSLNLVLYLVGLENDVASFLEILALRHFLSVDFYDVCPLITIGKAS